MQFCGYFLSYGIFVLFGFKYKEEGEKEFFGRGLTRKKSYVGCGVDRQFDLMGGGHKQ